ncbi:MAG: pseudouridine synthase [Gemmatimonadales bacterium]|nr:Ribosomal large subunit pseudouridine synthase A [bacterium HR33]GIW52745.1 MAG: pseudouridine synthase [Gemmatimonadales bacterium]
MEILFENDDLLVVNKPEGIASIPERDPSRPSVRALLEAQGRGPIYVVHRLDKEVSGVLVFAKSAAVHRELNRQFEERLVRKTYLALVHGEVGPEGGLIERPLRAFGSGRMGVDDIRGKPSATEYRVLERLRGYTLLNVFPVTGRRHQIRVHLYSIGHPIAGDLRYGDRAVFRQFPRLMLHAQRVEFALPSGEPLAVEAPVAASFRAVLENLPERLGDYPG